VSTVHCTVGCKNSIELESYGCRMSECEGVSVGVSVGASEGGGMYSPQ
jgi:hypothetical protein